MYIPCFSEDETSEGVYFALNIKKEQEKFTAKAKFQASVPRIGSKKLAIYILDNVN